MLCHGFKVIMKYEPHDVDRFEVNMSDTTGRKTLFSMILTLVSVIVLIIVLAQVINIFTPALLSRDMERTLVKKFNLGSMFSGKESKELTAFVTTLTDLNYPLQVSVVDSKELNAYCFFGDQLMITKSLLDTMESENELAFVLAHEAGHSFYRHNTKGLFFNVFYNLTLGLLGFNPSGPDFSSLTYSRKLEEQADEFAIKALNKHYGHTNGGADFFKRVGLKDLHSTWWSKLLERFYSTHPMTDTRVKTINKNSKDPKASPIKKAESDVFKSISSTKTKAN